MRRRKIGFFGGSFDPIHFGHINLAIELSEACQLDGLIFCPAYCSPFRGAHPPAASALHRLEMVKLAVSDIPNARVSAYEVERQHPSYTVDTLRAICDPSQGYHLLLSDESAAHFGQWKEVSELLRLAPPLIGTRSLASAQISEFEGCQRIQTRIFEISSTEVRKRLSQKLPCTHLVPAKVLDYIETHQLYSSAK